MHSSVESSLGYWEQSSLLAGPFMSMIDASVINVALPNMASTLHSSLAGVQWVASAYLLALGLGTTTTAYLAKRYGTHTLYSLSLLGFTLLSGLCALAPTLGILIGARVLQGLFGALLVPLAMNMLLGKQGASSHMSMWAGMILFLAPAVGPALGGILIQWQGWPLIFLINVPVGVIAFIGARRIPLEWAYQSQEATPFDLTGFILLTSGILSITYGASQATSYGWLRPHVWPYWVFGILLIAGYAHWVRRTPHPIINIKILQGNHGAISMTLMAIVSVVTFAVIILIPAYMQQVQHQTATLAGLTLLPQGIITGLGAWLGMKLPERWGMRPTIALGMTLLTATSFGLLAVNTATQPAIIALILCGRGFAIGFVIQPLITSLIGGLPEEMVADGNTLFNVVERVSGTLGIALIVTFFQHQEARHINQALVSVNTARLVSPALTRRLAQAATASFHHTIWLIVILSMLGLCLAAWTENGKVEVPRTSDA